MSHWALFHGDRQISRAHSTYHTAWIEALERGLVYSLRESDWLAPGYAIKEVADDSAALN